MTSPTPAMTPTAEAAGTSTGTPTATPSPSPHRHCLSRDLNGDEDTDDPGENTGGTCSADNSHMKLTCPKDANGDGDTDDPGENTGGVCPDLAWHPKLPNPGDPWWQTVLIGALIPEVLGGAGSGIQRKFGEVSRFAKKAGWIGGAVGIVGGGFYTWWNLSNNSPTINIAGHLGCFDPDVEDYPDLGSYPRYTTGTKTLSETKEAHGYQTIIKNVIKYCVPKS